MSKTLKVTTIDKLETVSDITDDNKMLVSSGDTTGQVSISQLKTLFGSGSSPETPVTTTESGVLYIGNHEFGREENYTFQKSSGTGWITNTFVNSTDSDMQLYIHAFQEITSTVQVTTSDSFLAVQANLKETKDDGESVDNWVNICETPLFGLNGSKIFTLDTHIAIGPTVEIRGIIKTSESSIDCSPSHGIFRITKTSYKKFPSSISYDYVKLITPKINTAKSQLEETFIPLESSDRKFGYNLETSFLGTSTVDQVLSCVVTSTGVNPTLVYRQSAKANVGLDDGLSEFNFAFSNTDTSKVKMIVPSSTTKPVWLLVKYISERNNEALNNGYVAKSEIKQKTVDDTKSLKIVFNKTTTLQTKDLGRNDDSNKMMYAFNANNDSGYIFGSGTYKVQQIDVNNNSLFIDDNVVTIPTDFAYNTTSSNKNIKSVRFNSNLEIIGIRAFSDNGNMSTADFSNCGKLKNIAQNSFTNCKSIETLDFSKCTSLETIKQQSFKGCTSLQNVYLQNCNNLKTIESEAFNGSKISSDIQLLDSKVQTIGSNAFYGATSKIISLPNTLTSIGNQAFADTFNANTVKDIRIRALVNDCAIGAKTFTTTTEPTTFSSKLSVNVYLSGEPSDYFSGSVADTSKMSEEISKTIHGLSSCLWVRKTKAYLYDKNGNPLTYSNKIFHTSDAIQNWSGTVTHL